MKKTCYCGIAFETNIPHKIYCSFKCKNISNLSKVAPDKGKHYKYKQRYNISLEEFNTMFANQNGCCKICKRHQSVFSKTLNVDHVHETGEVRGLLCNQCNQALGLMKENKETIKSMLEYIQ